MNVNVEKIERILAADRVWSAYALADLEPEQAAFCSWSVADDALILNYRRLDPPVLFTHGTPSGIATLLSKIPAGRYQFSIRPAHLIPISAAFEIDEMFEMWRMVYTDRAGTIGPGGLSAERLNAGNLDDLQDLFSDHPDAPDAFLESQLDLGVFYGVYDHDRLMAVSGTHILSKHYRLAAIGNVFTDPAYRGKGCATLTSYAVVQELLANGVETIVLNVAKANTAAVTAYKRIGFQTYCEFLEGYGKRIKR
ncbi:MAG: GNAT family N-acetyltransferase [Anaerolineales bacterium]|nr:GNAT family N-acetyltransferase [Anaerolineales bacterium]